MIKQCEEIRERDLEYYYNYANSVILQFLTILSTKGYKSLKLAAKFWSFSPIQQLRFILQLFETHFWIYPPIFVIWNEYQDNLHHDSDIKFQRTECQSKLDPEDINCFPSSSSTTEPMRITGTHTIEIECKSCPIISESNSKVTQKKTQRNIIKMICSCMKGSVAAKICFLTLFTRLDTRLYSHDHNMSQNHNMKPDQDVVLTIKDCTYVNDKGKKNEDIKDNLTVEDMESIISSANENIQRFHATHVQKEEIGPVVSVKRWKNMVAEEGAFTIGSYNYSFLPRMQSTGYGSASCSNSCVCFPPGALDNLLN